MIIISYFLLIQLIFENINYQKYQSIGPKISNSIVFDENNLLC